MSVCWTEDQKKVIDSRNQNLLVSAAAGSGKTAVLVERILTLITDPEHPVDVDRLLITTFTKAAAGEMKERIGKALSERLQEDPANEWLQRQEALVSRAQITTIHGFCLYVIRNYFHTIDLNPNFRIADEGEMRLLKQDTAEEILEEAFQEKSEAFLRFAESYGSGNKGNGLEELILQLYEYAVASPQPKRWLLESAAKYELPEDAGWSDFIGAEAILSELKTTAGDCLQQIQKAREIAARPDGPVLYEEALRSDAEFLQSLTDCRSIEVFEELICDISWQRLPSRRSKAMKDADEELCDLVMNIRNEVKETVKSLTNQYFSLPGELVMELMRSTAENVRIYVDMTLRFMERLEEKKRKKNILDFTDQEHLALKILTREEDGELVPSEVADVFADYFAEIMVDEYQDSNLVQEAILNSISGSRKGRDNRFMVGDVKQSIYRFRQAEPGLFLEKYRRYADGAGGMRIDLHQNFRSREEVLNPVNEVFEKIMLQELGGIEYDESAALKLGASYPENDRCQAELLTIGQEDWEELRTECSWTKQEAEAHLTAGYIRKVLEEGYVTEKGTYALRKATPGDIVILLRTMSGWSETFVRVLQEEGIPASAQSREGYFQTLEVETLLSYLRVLDNPTQEIPLAAAMHGMLGGFTSEEMAQIKAAYPEEGYAKACQHYMQNGPQDNLRQRVRAFYEQVQGYRTRAAYTSIHELLWQIVTETGYIDEVRAMPGGEQRLANVEMLLQKAQDYEKISYHGLFHFIRYIERMQKYQMDFGEADISGAGGEAVQIMSIHHSKGLEYPIVFVSGMGKSFNKQESRDKAVFHNRYGIGLDYVDLENRMRRPTILKQFIRRRNLLDNLGEELRILYVAMTRAREKLILTGMVKEKLLESAGAGTDEKLSFMQLTGADSFLGWLLPAYNAENGNLTHTHISMEVLLKQTVQGQMQKALSREALDKVIWFQAKDESLYQQIDEKLSWSYPWNLEKQSKQKYTVTELKKLRVQEPSDSSEELYPTEDIVPVVPQFIEQTEEKTGAARGTVYHTVMEWLDFAGMTELSQVKDGLRSLQEQNKLSEEDLRCVNPRDFLIFAKCGLAERIHQAKERGELYREQPFVIGLPGDEVDGSDVEELVLIQGIIDAFFYEDDEIVVLDYKTDMVYRAEELVEKYRAQLGYYEKALEMMTGKKVKERLIYSFRLGRVIEV
ncbi:MAG: helicase-exonuclease AddAB subunit AddA [Lachnospiraceae bacterium]|nr:helicase-exonuclease AddAB subunit AddA [Lachnospiraceae bacterium]